VAGTVAGSLVVGVVADRLGRRRTYLLLYLALAGTGAVYAFSGRWPVLAAVAMVGVLSTEVVESGPFTTLEQAMLATTTVDARWLVTGSAGTTRSPPPRAASVPSRRAVRTCCAGWCPPPRATSATSLC
jgi:MFS family permease